MKCLKCGNENKSDIKNCEYCGTLLINLEGKVTVREMTKKDYIIAALIVIVPILSMMVFGLTMMNIDTLLGFKEKKPENSKTTVGILKDFEECHYDEEKDYICKGVYSYEVDGKEYFAKTTYFATKKTHSYDNEVTIHYNQNNPNNSSIEINKSSFSQTIEKTVTYSFLVFALTIIIVTIVLLSNAYKKQHTAKNF